MKCDKCLHMATKTTPSPGQFLIWGCRKLKIQFGNTTDYRAKKNFPTKCKDYEPN